MTDVAESPGIPAVFLDRDGTLIEDRGHLRTAAEAVFFPSTVPSLRRLGQNFRLFIVTNQPGIAEGIITSAEAAAVNEFIVRRLAGEGVVITDVYCCPHRRAEGCRCIKPKPFFLEQATCRYGIDLSRSFVVGDHPHDVDLARNVGATGIYVLTGHGAKHQADLPPETIVVPGISEAARHIIELAGLGAPTDSPSNVPGR